MPLIRRLLGPALQQAFDLDRESGPRWLQQDAVYLFSDPLQRGYSLREQQVTHIRNEFSSNLAFVEPGEDHAALVRAFLGAAENNSGASADVEARLILHLPEEGSSGFTDLQLWESDTITLANNETVWFRMQDFPFMRDFRVPPRSELRFTLWGLSGSSQEWTIRALWDKIPKDVYLAP